MELDRFSTSNFTASDEVGYSESIINCPLILAGMPDIERTKYNVILEQLGFQSGLCLPNGSWHREKNPVDEYNVIGFK